VQPLLPLFSRHFGVSPTVSSLSLSLTTGILALTLLLAGMLSGALDRKRVMIASLLSTAALSVVAALAPGWTSLLAARGLEGVALGGVPALALAYLSEEVHPDHLGAAAGLYIAGTAFGGMDGRVLAGVAADLFGWRVALAFIGVLGFIAAALFIVLLPRSRHFVPQRGLRLVEHVSPLASHLRHGALPWVFACGFLFMGGFVSVYNYISYRLAAPPFALSQIVIGTIFIVYLLGIAASAAFGRVADRIGRPPVLALAIILMGLGLLLMMPASLVAIVAGLGLLTIGFFAGHSVASGWVGLLAEHGKGHAAGLYLLAYYLGSSVLGSLGGLFWSTGGWTGVAAMVGVALAAGAIAVARLIVWQKRQPTGGG
jgi:YNFM family putative membrane transporter